MAEDAQPTPLSEDLKIRISLDALSKLPAAPPSPRAQRTKCQRPVTLHLVRVPEGLQIAPKVPKKQKLEANNAVSEHPYVCHIHQCGKEFSEGVAFRKHQATHSDRQYICPESSCGRKFLDNSKLRRHMLVHTGEKPYLCEFCEKRFSLDFNLKTHLRIHTGEKPYQCRFHSCQKRFTQSSNLAAHERSHTCKEGELRPRIQRRPEPEGPYSPSNLYQPAFSLELQLYSADQILCTATPALPETGE